MDLFRILTGARLCSVVAPSRTGAVRRSPQADCQTLSDSRLLHSGQFVAARDLYRHTARPDALTGDPDQRRRPAGALRSRAREADPIESVPGEPARDHVLAPSDDTPREADGPRTSAVRSARNSRAYPVDPPGCCLQSALATQGIPQSGACHTEADRERRAVSSGHQPDQARLRSDMANAARCRRAGVSSISRAYQPVYP